MPNPFKRKNEGTLSAGNKRQIGFGNRPALAVDDAFDEEQESSSRKNRKPRKAGKNAFTLTIVKTVFALLTMFLILAVSVWGLLGITILPTLRTGGETWVVKWAAWAEGTAPAGSVAMFSVNPAPKDLIGRVGLLLASEDSLSVHEIIAGPGGTYEAGYDLQLLKDGEPTGFYVDEIKEPKLVGENYLTICITGGCDEGTIMVVPVGHLLGEVIGSLGLSTSLGDVPTITQEKPDPLPEPEPEEEPKKNNKKGKGEATQKSEDAAGARN